MHTGEAVTREELAEWCAREESTLRNQYPDGQLPEHAELALLRFTVDTLTGALRRWAYLKHLYYSRAEGLAKAGTEDQAADVARQLLRREPVRVELGTRAVQVTGRSYAALAEIAAHASRLAEIEQDLRRLQALEADALAELAAPGPRRQRNRHRRRFRRLGEIHRRLLVEGTLHRKAIYAHVFTADGAPAGSLDDAPSWWEELTPAHDALLIAAVWEAGIGRYARLGPAPATDDGGRERAEDWGWGSCLCGWERHLRVAPATFYDRDLGQLATWIRGAAPAGSGGAGDDGLDQLAGM